MTTYIYNVMYVMGVRSLGFKWGEGEIIRYMCVGLGVTDLRGLSHLS